MNQGFGFRLLALALVVGCCCTARAEIAAPKIVLIVAADRGREALGCYKNKAVTTPHLNALAADGTRFTDAFCTTASCRPARSVMLTGPPNRRNGIHGFQHHPPHFPPFDPVKNRQMLLAAADYRTAQIGKFHVGPEAISGFQTVRSAGAANDPATIGRSPVEMAEPSRSLIEAHDARPFFFFFAKDDQHRANAVLPEGSPSFETYPKSNRWGNRPQGYTGGTPVEFRPEDVSVAPYLPDSPAGRAELTEYYQAIARLDQSVGRLITLSKPAKKYDAPDGLYFRQQRAVSQLEDHARQARHALAVHRADPGPGARGCGAGGDGHVGGSAADLPRCGEDRGADGGLQRTVFSRRTRRRETDGTGRGVRLALVPRGDGGLPDADGAHARIQADPQSRQRPAIPGGERPRLLADVDPCEREWRPQVWPATDITVPPPVGIRTLRSRARSRRGRQSRGIARAPAGEARADRADEGFQQATKDPWFHKWTYE